MSAGLLLNKRAHRVEDRAPSGKRLRVRIPGNTDLACKCQPDDCEYARFADGVAEQALDDAFEAETLSAFHNDYSRPLGNVAKGNIRRIGPNEIEIDIPIGTNGDGVINAIEDAGIVARPFIDTANSTLKKVGATAVYSAVAFRSIIVSSTDAKEGWPEPELIEDGSRNLQLAANSQVEYRYIGPINESEKGHLKATVMQYRDVARIGPNQTEEFLPGSLNHSDVTANIQHVSWSWKIGQVAKVYSAR